MEKSKNKKNEKRKSKKSWLQRIMEKMAGMRGNPIKTMDPGLNGLEDKAQ
ncbi:hypothetical protein ACFLY1_00515 [Patescibacteria group bacterium]